MPIRILTWSSQALSRPGNFVKRSCCNYTSLFQRSDYSLFSKHKSQVPPPPLRISLLVKTIEDCIKLKNVPNGSALHCLAFKFGLFADPFLATTILDMYSKCGFVDSARQVFDESSMRDLVIWNVILSCYAMHGLGTMAFDIFSSMRSEEHRGDEFTFSSLINVCSKLGFIELGRQVHCLCTKSSYEKDIVIGSALVNMFIKCGDMNDAERLFDEMPNRNIVSWNSIIVGYGMHGRRNDTMNLLKRMYCEGLYPDEVTLATVLSSCSFSAAATTTIQIHGIAVPRGLHRFTSVGNAFMNAYSKCGCICEAVSCFASISNPDIVSWSSMISAYAFHGLPKESMHTFSTMLRNGVVPDSICFLGVLSACSHAGLVDKGLQLFASMSKDYQIKPRQQHYACMIDLLGRAGRIDEAIQLLSNIVSQLSADILGTLINACKIHGRLKLVKVIVDEMLLHGLQTCVTSANYSMISNMFAENGCWDEVAKVRKGMRTSCGQKVAGFSWIEIGGELHRFVSHDESHRNTSEIYYVLHLVDLQMKNNKECVIP